MRKRPVFDEEVASLAFLDKKAYELEQARVRKLQGRRIQLARRSAKLSQRQVAEYMGVHTNAIGLYERGQVWANWVRLWQLAIITKKPMTFFVPKELLGDVEIKAVELFSLGVVFDPTRKAVPSSTASGDDP